MTFTGIVITASENAPKGGLSEFSCRCVWTKKVASSSIRRTWEPTTARYSNVFVFFLDMSQSSHRPRTKFVNFSERVLAKYLFNEIYTCFLFQYDTAWTHLRMTGIFLCTYVRLTYFSLGASFTGVLLASRSGCLFFAKKAEVRQRSDT